MPSKLCWRWVLWGSDGAVCVAQLWILRGAWRERDRGAVSVSNPGVAYGVFEGPTRFGKRVPGDAQVKDPNGIGPCEEGEIRTAFGAGGWGGKLPSTWEVIDAEMYAILAYLRKMASASDAHRSDGA